MRADLGDNRYDALYDASAALPREDALDELRKRFELTADEPIHLFGEPGE